MARNKSSRVTDDWRKRTHEVQFTATELDTIRVLVDADDRDLEAVLLDLVVDNAAFRIKSSEHYSSYTFSYTLDRDHPKYPAHTVWFYDTSLARGVRVMSAYVQTLMADYLAGDRITEAQGLW